MIRRPLTEDSLGEAMRRFEEFAVVHHGKGDYEEALTVLRESLGIDQDRLEQYRERIIDILGADGADPGFLSGSLLGLIVGLIAADYASEA